MKYFHELQEGLNDPNIFKAFFLAGGPGSGKSYVVRKTTGGTGLQIVNSDDAFERYIQQAGLSKKMPDDEFDRREPLRIKAKKVTASRIGDISTGKGGYLEGRLGIIIDGTGKNYDKIVKQSTELKQLGYDTHMVFVNTSLDTALQRNAKRSRSVPERIAVQAWKDVQSNIGKFSQHFKQNFVVVDNNDSEEDVMTPVFRQIKGLLRKKVTSPIAKEWVMNQMKLRGITRAPKGW